MFQKSMHVLSLWFLALTISAPASAADSETREPSEALEQLAFTQGDWALTAFMYNDDGTVARQFGATMTVKPILGGKGYLEQRTFPNATDPSKFYAMAIVFTVKPETGELVGALNNTLGNRKVLTQVPDSDGVVFEMRGELFDSATGYMRLNYIPIDEDKFEFVQDYCPTPGEACIERTFSFMAERAQ